MTDPLGNCRDGATKQAIIAFVRSVTQPGDGVVPPMERIATFDNDGTLWSDRGPR